MGTECQLDFSDEDSKMLDEAEERGVVIPECFREVTPEVERILQEKAAEIDKLETPREERAMRLIESATEGQEASVEEKGEDVKIYKALGICPIKISGFNSPSSWLGSNENAIEVLDRLPQIGLLAFEEIKYVEDLGVAKDRDGQIEMVLGEATPEKSGRVPLLIGMHHPDYFKEEYPELEGLTPQDREQKMVQIEEESIVHEYAHGLWRELMTLDEQWEWLTLHDQTPKDGFVTGRASASVKEDFCECCAKFISNPETLKENDEKKYNFVKDYFAQLEEESQWLDEQVSE